MKEEEIRKIFSRNLKSYRKKLGLSQMDLASKAGIATNFVNDIENEKKWISPATLAKICTALDIEPYKLFLEIDFENSSSNKLVNQFCSEITNDFFTMINKISDKYSF